MIEWIYYFAYGSGTLYFKEQQKYDNIQNQVPFSFACINTKYQILHHGSCRKTGVSKLLGLFSNNEIR